MRNGDRRPGDPDRSPSSPGNGPPGGREILSEEEVRDLLGVPAAAAAGGSRRGGPRRVLLVSRRDEDLQVLARALGENEMEISISRNPFTALDYLRSRDFCAVISDYSIWVSGGALLFERLSKLDRAVGVIFICDPDADDADAARRSGAIEVLERPLSAAAVVGAVRRLGAGEAPVHPTAPAPPPPREEPRAAPAPEPLPDPAGAAPARAEAPAAGRAPSEPPSEPGAGERTWLEFCFEVRRAIRSALEPEIGWRTVLDRFLEAQGGGAAAIIGPGPAGGDSVRRGIFRVAVLAPSGSGEREADLLARLFQVLPSVAGPLLAPGAAPSAAGGNPSPAALPAGVLAISWRGPDGQARALLSILTRERSRRGIPRRILEEIPFILEDAERILLGR